MPNYDAASVEQAAQELEKAGLPARLMIDCSHANSQKQYQRQVIVGQDVAQQVANGDKRIMGVMIESHLVAGRQDAVPGNKLVYGPSITDACIGWEESVILLQELAQAVIQRRGE